MKKKLNLNNVVLGTAQFGSNYGIRKKFKSVSISKKILNEAKSKNIKILDIADNYYKSFQILKKENLNKWKICFKISDELLKKNKKDDDFLKLFFYLLKKLKIKKFEYFLFHNIKSLNYSYGKKIYNYLIQLKKRGLIKKIGVSLYSPIELKKLIKKFKFEVVQIPLNVFDQRFLENNFLKTLKKNKIEIHARSIFLQGLIGLNSRKLPKKFWFFSDTFRKWEKYLNDNKSNSLIESLSFIGNIKEIDKIVIGVDNPKQLSIFQNKISKNRPVIYSKFKCQSLDLIDPRRW